MKRTIYLLIFTMFLALAVYGFDPVFLSSLSPESLRSATYNYTVTGYNGTIINGVLMAKVQDNNEILVSMKIGERKKRALIRYSSNRGDGIDAFYIYNDSGEKIPFYESSKRNQKQNPNNALNKYELVYRKPTNVRTLAGTFTVTESKYRRHNIKKINKNDLEMITETNDEIIVDEYHGFPVQILEDKNVRHRIVNLRDTTMIIPNKRDNLVKRVKIEITSYEENH
ncbi:hypothetical protein J7J58_07800 [candidate division WOR-3 bacterium]|uniref:Uncharacterized protein n=1 Tax=candidate division TA06 bacterium TaxID=2250710 RepID=A0A660S7F5_UNCT6|nr:hypothetical protein [candidate division WOR-3 bacterium]RKX65140.1 MAG: hypothetical protein DRP44_06980 [candidate division TA06 bacterium]